VKAFYDAGPGITLEIRNRGGARAEVEILDGYSGRTHSVTVAEGESVAWYQALQPSFGWYDLSLTVASDASFLERIAGHVENGSPSISDPALGG
jgi:phospholipase C